jgi:hypothetical protein
MNELIVIELVVNPELRKHIGDINYSLSNLGKTYIINSHRKEKLAKYLENLAQTIRDELPGHEFVPARIFIDICDICGQGKDSCLHF